MRAELEFTAMGTTGHVKVWCAPASSEALRLASTLARLGVGRIEMLEQSWSRFRDDSELSLLNSRAGMGPVPVSEDLFELVSRMLESWQATEGRFDPTVLASIVHLGYDADFAEVIARNALTLSSNLSGNLAAAVPGARGATPGMGGIVLDEELLTISLPAGIGLDPGAIGKGLAADIVTRELRSSGASAVLVNIGGDLVFDGTPDDGPSWSILIEDERGEQDHLVSFDPAATHGAVATSTTLRRRWGRGRHHVIDPRTGLSSAGPLVQATVVADSGWWAEVATTAALLQRPEEARAWLDDRNLHGLLMTEDALIGVGNG